MSIEGTSRTISVAAVASAGIHALLYLALSTYGQRPIEPPRSSAEVQLVLAPAETEPAVKMDTSPTPELAKVEPAQPDVKVPEVSPPPPPPPPKEEVERVRLGNQNSPETETKTWLGSEKPDPNQARKASVEQGAYTQSPGLPGNPSETMGPESAMPTAVPSPSTDGTETPRPPTESLDAPPVPLSPVTPPGPAVPPVPPSTQVPPSAETPRSVEKASAEQPAMKTPSAETVNDASATPNDSSAPPPPPPVRTASPAPVPAMPPAISPDGLLAPQRAVPPSTPATDITSLLVPKDASETNEINLEDLFPTPTLTASLEKPAKTPKTREQAIAMLREAFAFPAFARPSAPAAPMAPPSPQPAPKARANSPPAGGGSTGDRPFEKSDRDVDPSSLEEPIEVKPGRPLAAKGLEIKTVTLDLTTLSRRFTWTTNPVVLVKFGRSGTVVHADFVKGQTAGSPEWNNALLAAMYRWTAAGEELKKLPKNNPEAGVEVQFRILLRD